MTITLSDEERELFVNHVEVVNSSVIALAGCIEESGDVRDMILRTALSSGQALLHLAEMWGLYVSEDEVAEDLMDLAGGATDDPATCGHPICFPDLPNGQKMCESCGASRVGDVWIVL